MTGARICDKCEKVFKSKDTQQIHIHGLYSNENLNFDLCTECLEKFKNVVSEFS